MMVPNVGSIEASLSGDILSLRRDDLARRCDCREPLELYGQARCGDLVSVPGCAGSCVGLPVDVGSCCGGMDSCSPDGPGCVGERAQLVLEPSGRCDGTGIGRRHSRGGSGRGGSFSKDDVW